MRAQLVSAQQSFSGNDQLVCRRCISPTVREGSAWIVTEPFLTVGLAHRW